MIDSEIIEARVDIIEENLAYLEKVAGTGYDGFAKNFERVQAVKHCLQEAIEACIDIANHIIAGQGPAQGRRILAILQDARQGGCHRCRTG